MRSKIYPNGVTLWLSARDTEAWAHRPGKYWPCSELSGKRLCATFDNGGLVDVTIDGRYGDFHRNVTEFNAITSDHLAKVLPPDHPAYFVTVGQFKRDEEE